MWQRIRVQPVLEMPPRSANSALFEAPLVMLATGVRNTGVSEGLEDQSVRLVPSQPQYSATRFRASLGLLTVHQNRSVAFVIVALSGMDDVSHRSRALRT